MDYSVDTPFRTYQEIQEAVKAKRASLSYQRSAAYNVACRVNSINVISNLIIPIVSVVAMLAACSFFSISKWVLLFGVAVLFVNTLVPHLKGLFWFLAIALIVLPLVLLKGAMWLLAIGVGIIGMMLGYYIWWGIISGVATNAIMTDESLFEAVWTASRVALKTNSTIDGFYVYGCGKGSNS